MHASGEVDGSCCYTYTPTFETYDKAYPVTVPSEPLLKQQEQPRAAIANIPTGSEFYIKPAANVKRCLSVCSDGFTKDPFEVFLTDVDPTSKKQKWRLVDGDTFQNVESGQFLHSATKYVTISNIDVIRAGTYTGLVTRPQDFSDAQRWVFGPEKFFGRR